MSLKSDITQAMKDAMKAKNKDKLAAIRLITAAIKQREVDERIELTDEDILSLLDKLSKQRRDSIKQFQDAGRDDLVAQEEKELAIIQEFLPEQLTEDEILALIKEAIDSAGASEVKDMGKVMANLKPKLSGRADVGAVSKLVREQLLAS